ncbi:MAG: proteasome component M29 [Piccolia ochrophora]|nr:MAG: proteasome component M29 [Piccolia ochrophora]
MADASKESAEARELNLLSKVEMRIALADTDKKLESILNTYLAPLLLKLASDHLAVRNKVIAICQHVSTRTQPPTVKLPVRALLRQYKENATPLIRHFDLRYIQQGIGRIAPNERVDLLPTLIHGLAGNAKQSEEHAAILFNLLVKILPHVQFPLRGSKEDDDMRKRLIGSSEDAALLAYYLGRLIMLTKTQTSGQGSTPAARTCPGVSVKEFEFLTLNSKDTWDPSKTLTITEAKIAACRFLNSAAFDDRERFMPGILASQNSNSRISDIGVEIVKRASPSVSLEDENLLKDIFTLYFGDTATLTPPAELSLKTRLLGLLSKSTKATSFTELIVRQVEEGISLRGSESSDTRTKSQTGREQTKFREALVSFINWVSRMGSLDDRTTVAPRLLYSLRDYIEAQGWPDPHPDQPAGHSESGLRGFAYESMGLLSKSLPADVLLDTNLDLIRWMFTSLSSDSSGNDVSLSIEESLGGFLQALNGLPHDEVEEALRSLLLRHMHLSIGDESPAGLPAKVRRSTRWSAVRFANRVLPYNDVVARWIDILAIGGHAGERGEVAEEGRKGLDPYWYSLLNPTKDAQDLEAGAMLQPKFKFPVFADLVRYVLGEPSSRDSMDIDHSAVIYDVSSNAFLPAVRYCRLILLNEILAKDQKAAELDLDWERKLDIALTADENVRNTIKAHMRSVSTSPAHDAHARSLSRYIGATLEGAQKNESSVLVCSQYFVEICSLSTNRIVEPLADKFEDLIPLILSNDMQVRTAAAQAYGILASQVTRSRDAVDVSLDGFWEKIHSWEKAVGSEVNKVHGSILALTFLVSRAKVRGSFEALPPGRFQDLLSEVLKILRLSKDQVLQAAAFTAISQLSLFTVLRPSLLLPKEKCDEMVENLVSCAKTGKEKAMVALGQFAMTCGEFEDAELLQKVLDSLYDLHELKQPEVQLTVGESLSCLAVGWDSKSLIAALDVDVAVPQTASRQSSLPAILDRILEDCRKSKPSLRRACVIWLVSLVQFCGHWDAVQDRLRACQGAFKAFLSDRDDLVQESASRGLTLVYERGNKELKDDLVRDLVSSFTSSSTSSFAGSVAEDTELFEPGALPTGDGSVSTYKDIMSLASEVGDPSLVYRFMSLAANNAIWSSRAAFGRFGLSNILSESTFLSENPKLYAKLFRYRFDPNTNVQRSMNDIWSALVKDSSATVEKYFDDIMEDLLKSILVGREWRVRQASCSAIADLIQGQQFSKYEKYLGEVWTVAFKVLDDIKESVRGAAMGFCRVLTTTLVRAVESDAPSRKADAMLKDVMPFLMSTSGIEASAKEVQAFALDTILRLAKTSTKALRPHVPALIERLLGLLSTLEHEAVNYLHLNAAKYNLTEEKIDAARLQNIRSSPVMDAIERCLDILDEDTMKLLMPRLQAAMREAVGMPSKVGCSRVLVTLATRHNFLFKPYADTLLKAVEKTLVDRNETVSSSYATATGYLARVGSDAQILKMSGFARRLYFSAEDRRRTISGDIIMSIAKYATDRFNSLAVEFLPFVFVAKHDSHEQVRELFQTTWSDNVGGAKAVMLYLDDIVSIAAPHLDSASWAIKHTAALSIADAAKLGGKDMTLGQQSLLWPPLEKAVSGKTWEGKSTVLEAFVAFAKNSARLQEHNPGLRDQMTKICLREASRNNADYRVHAVRCLGLYAESYTGDISREVIAIAEPIVDDFLDEESTEMDVDSVAGKASTGSTEMTTIANTVECTFKSLNPKVMSDDDATPRMVQALSLAQRVKAKGSEIVRSAICKGIRDLAIKLQEMDEHKRNDLITIRMVDALSPLAVAGSGARQIRPAAEAAAEVATLLDGWNKYDVRVSDAQRTLQGEVETAMSLVKAPEVLEVLERAMRALKSAPG